MTVPTQIQAPSASGEPPVKRAVAFFDGQNLYHYAREVFKCTHPDYDVLALSQHVCAQKGWMLKQVRFYTGIPEARHDDFWNKFWGKKLLAMKRQGVNVFSRNLRYRDKQVRLSDGATITIHVGEEKGIDVRISLDCIRLALNNDYDVAIIFSQDQDLSEVASEMRDIARSTRRWIKVASAYPYSDTAANKRGINNTDWIKITSQEYELCKDKNDYRPLRQDAASQA